MVVKIIKCSNCGLPLSLRSDSFNEMFKPKWNKLRIQFKNMEKCKCKHNRINERLKQK